jgi:PPOX class probable F420-dependent enzyme
MVKTEATLSQQLKGQQFCLLTTLRKDGSAVPTPMWFALKGETVYMSTRGASAKVKRLRREPRVTIGPCNGSGRPTGPQVEALAGLVETAEETAQAEACLSARYGLKRRLLRWALRFAKDKTDAYIRVNLT